MSEGTRGLIVPSELVIELEREYDKSRERIAELEKQLAAMSEPPVWRDGPPPKPGWWWTQYASGVCYLRHWDQQMIDTWPKSEHRHAPGHEWLKPPVEPNPAPKPDPCEDFIKANIADNAMVKIGDLWLMPCQLRHLWPHIEAAIKGGVK